MSFLVISGKPQNKDLYSLWSKINNEYLSIFGLPDNYLRHLKLKERYCKEIERVWIKGERYRMPFADIALIEAEALVNDINQEFEQTLGTLSKNMGFRIDPMTTSVYLFFSYKKTVINGKKALE